MKITIYKQPGMPGNPSEGWVVEHPATFEHDATIFVTPSWPDAIDYARQTLNVLGAPGDVKFCQVCAKEVIWCIEPITGIEGWAICGTHENSVDAFVCQVIDGDISGHNVILVPREDIPVVEVNEPVYNDLTPPWVAQAYANIHAKIESFIIDAIDAGVVREDLERVMLSDIDQLIANHSPN